MSENREVEQAYGRNLFAQNDVNRSVNPCVKKEHKMTKYEVSEILCLIFLYLCSREDYRYKALTVHKIGIFGCAGLVYTLAADTMSVQSMMAGAGLGGMVILVSRCSPDWLGEGDGWMFVVTGLFLGGRQNLAILCIAMFLSGIYCLLGVLLKKYQKTDHVALAPFVLAAEVVLLYLK